MRASRDGSAAEAVKAALADPDCLMVNRNAGAGTRILIDQLLGGARPPGYGNQPRSHNAVAAAVAQGRADWGVAIAPVARHAMGSASCRSRRSTTTFCWSSARRERPAVAAFLALLADPDVRDGLRRLGFRPAGQGEP